MANKGVYSREDNSPEGVGRSVQDLSHRNTFDMRMMEIYPNFADYIYPNEKFEITTTNFLRTIPMVAPALSRIRIVQRFYAVPLRIMWQPWERYIDISNEDYDFTLEEPYLINYNTGYTQNSSGVTYNNTYNDIPFFSYDDSVTEHINGRGFLLDSDGHVPQSIPTTGNGRGSLIVAPHDLLDYFSAPLNSVVSPGSGRTSRFSAYKACAYQMSYNFGYRLPNVQKRVDDYYEMLQNDELLSGNYFIDLNPSGDPITKTLKEAQADTSLAEFVRNSLYASHIARSSGSMSDLAQSDNSENVLRTSWDRTDLFPLKSGANASLQAWRLNEYGSLEFVPSNISLTRKRYANWSMDYFTSCNPWQQRGLEANIPVSGTVNVTLPDSTTVSLSGLEATIPKAPLVATLLPKNEDTNYVALNPFVSGTETSAAFSGVSTGGDASGDNVSYARLYSGSATVPVSGSATASFSSSSATATTSLYVSPSNFRFAMALQRVKEMSARTDGRYQHYLSKFFGSFVKNDEIDYPQFLGGFVQDLNVDTVTQTSESGSTDLGTLAGNGISAKQGYKITYYAKEHCVIIGMIHIIPDSEYVGGLDRQDNTSDPYDWMLPQFSGLSEQPVFNSELAYSGADSVDKLAFGYQPYLNYLRGKQNRACGAFRDNLNITGSYEYYKPWIIQRDFGYQINSATGALVHNVPTLSDKFLSGRGTVDNSLFTVSDDNLMYPFMCDSYFKVRAVRTIPARGIPRI